MHIFPGTSLSDRANTFIVSNIMVVGISTSIMISSSGTSSSSNSSISSNIIISSSSSSTSSSSAISLQQQLVHIFLCAHLSDSERDKCGQP